MTPGVEERDAREQYLSDGRQANRLLNFLDGWSCAIGLAKNKRRDAILARLPHDLDRQQFLDIEPQIIGCTYQTLSNRERAELTRLAKIEVLSREIERLEREGVAR